MLNKVDVKNLKQNAFSLIGDQWMLITAGTPQRCNTMTANWGGLGVLWGADVATCYIRPQRYTNDFVEKSDYFTLSFLGEEYRKELSFCGSKSGREVDKIKECGFHISAGEGDAPFFQEAELVLICRKLYWQDMDPTHILTPEIDEKWYPQKDYHRIYIGEIAQAYQKD